MPTPFDSTFRLLIDDFPADWLDWLRSLGGLPPGSALAEIDTDVGTIGARADKLYRGDGVLLHAEVQLKSDRTMPDRMLLYSVQATHRHGGPVRSVLILPRREGNASTLTGHLQRQLPDGTNYLDFRYSVVRLWELPAGPLLNGPLGTSPLAALTDEAEPQLPTVVARINERFRTELPEERAARAEAAILVLLGLRYNNDDIERLFQGVEGMEESSTYQAIIRKGQVRGVRQSIKIAGEAAFGPIPPEAESALMTIDDPDRLVRITTRLRTADNWDDLLAAE